MTMYEKNNPTMLLRQLPGIFMTILELALLVMNMTNTYC